jgi:DNA-binding response OmpR family regulator
MAAVTVLVVEDDPVILRLLEVGFEIEGFDVVVAHDGQQGIDAAGGTRVDIVVSDVMMPVKSGLELVRELRAEPTTANVPIILLSAKAQAVDVEMGLEAGADDYITKPFEPVELVDRVTSLLQKL